MRNRRTTGEARWPHAAEFVALAETWRPDAVTQLLEYVWLACDLLCEEVLAQVDCARNNRDLERSLTQYIERRIHRVMPGDSPFYVQHNPHEFATAKMAPAAPPMPDIAFVLWSNERIMWPLEAKTLRSDAAVAPYVTEIRKNFLTCRYAPFSSQGGMLGYLVAGNPLTAFKNIAARLPCQLEDHPDFLDRNHKTSKHERTVPPQKPYSRRFRCHHMILPLMNN